jgi:anti-anti-sigma regulatory factor
VPPDAVPGGRDWDGHRVLLHRDDHERLDRLARWVRHGLHRGEKILYVESADAGAGSVAVQLRAHGIDTDALRAEGRLQLITPQVYYPVGGPEAAISRALADGFPAVRISGAASAALAVITRAGHRDIEWGVERLCRVWPVSALCQYAYPPEPGLLRTALSLHPGGLHERSLAASSTPVGTTLHGRVDTSNVDVLDWLVDAAADRARAAGRDRLHLDLADVELLTAPACRAVAQASEPFRRAGGNLVLDRPAPVVEEALRTCGLAGLPGVEVVAS